MPLSDAGETGTDTSCRLSATRRGVICTSAAVTGGLAGCTERGDPGETRGEPRDTAEETPPHRTPTASGETPTQARGETAQWGTITYPLLGNLRSGAGSLIVHFRIEAADLETEPGPWYFPEDEWYRFRVADLAVNEENSMLLYWYRGSSGRGQMNASVGNLPGGPGSMPASGITGDWEAFEQHYVAFTWDGEGTLSHWLDGRLVEQQGVGGASGLGSVADDGQLTLGEGGSPLTLYGVHVLGEPLPDEDLRTPVDDVADLFKPRSSSLLLDRYSGENFRPDGERQTRADVISGFSGERGGTPTADCRFGETPFGEGLRVYTPPAGVDVS